MVGRRPFLTLLAVAIVGLVAWRLFVPSEERRIRKTFDRAAQLLAKDGTEPVFAAAAKARDLAALVAPNAHLDIPERNLDFRLNGEGLARQIALVRSQAQFIRVTFEDLAIVFSDDDTALVSADVFFKGTSDLMGFSGSDARELAATLKRENGDWRFAAIALKPIVEK